MLHFIIRKYDSFVIIINNHIPVLKNHCSVTTLT